jgi:thiamine pyrophosphate-dependent acetolactate synthase large subunit-like protein
VTPPGHPGIDVDLGMGIDVDVSVEPADAETDEAETSATAYLLGFDEAVDPADAEAVLGELSPPEESIVLAGQGAVIVRARPEFVRLAERSDCVALVNAVRTPQWEPNRHRVSANDD